jgi:hypothetical protein
MSERRWTARGLAIGVVMAVLAGIAFAVWVFERIVATG